MPEGDTVSRAALTMHRALAGATVLEFESRVATGQERARGMSLVGRQIQGVESRGKYLLIHFSGELALLSHLRMHGSWHLYRSGDRWRAPRRAMRVRLVTAEWEAVAFDVPVVELHLARALARDARLTGLGGDPLSADFDREVAVTRLRTAGDTPVEEALLDQRYLAGVGNVLKSEILFMARTFPLARVADLADTTLAEIVEITRRVLRANVAGVEAGAGTARAGTRNTTGSSNPASTLFVYARAGRPCRRCGATIQHQRSRRFARSTYWCPGCQAR